MFSGAHSESDGDEGLANQMKTHADVHQLASEVRCDQMDSDTNNMKTGIT